MTPKWRPREDPGEPKWSSKCNYFVDISQPPPRSPPTPLQGLEKVAKIDQHGCQNGPKWSPRDPPETPKGSKMDETKAPETPPETEKGAKRDRRKRLKFS